MDEVLNSNGNGLLPWTACLQWLLLKSTAQSDTTGLR